MTPQRTVLRLLDGRVSITYDHHTKRLTRTVPCLGMDVELPNLAPTWWRFIKTMHAAGRALGENPTITQEWHDNDDQGHLPAVHQGERREQPPSGDAGS